MSLDLGFLWETQVAMGKLRVGLVSTDVGSSQIQWSGTPGEPVNYVPWLGESWRGLVP